MTANYDTWSEDEKRTVYFSLATENERLKRIISIFVPALELLKTECNGIARKALTKAGEQGREP